MSGGLDKEGRLGAEEDERQRKLREATRSLDPQFPFVALAFDPVFFELKPASNSSTVNGTTLPP